jgi:Flp pilus assembly protein TadB
MLGRDWTTEQLGKVCIAFGVLIAMLMLTRLHSVVVIMMVLASTVALLWATNNANAAEEKKSAE